jgi:hypothetical protein
VIVFLRVFDTIVARNLPERPFAPAQEPRA